MTTCNATSKRVCAAGQIESYQGKPQIAATLSISSEVIGMNTAKLVAVGGIPAEGLGFSIVVNTIKEYLARLKNGAIITR